MGLSEAAAGHPYLPTSLELPGFHPAMMSVEFILGCYGGASALVVLVVWLASGRVSKLRTVDRVLMCWFAFSGLTHIVLEGYFVFTPDFITFNKPHLLAESSVGENVTLKRTGYGLYLTPVMSKPGRTRSRTSETIASPRLSGFAGMGLTEAAAFAGHPYLPTSLELPGFHPAMMSVESILGSYGGGVALVVIVVWLTSGRVAKLTTADRILMCWFSISGLTHLTLELYFVLTPDFYTSVKPNLLAEVWKEYSKADSRIAGRDPTVLVIEGIHAFIAGPVCLLAVYAIGAKAAYEHSSQLVVSTVQVYATVTYFLTVALAGIEFCLPHPLYFWFYFICMNSIWLVVPFSVACRSWRAINVVFASAKKKTA